MEIPPPAYEHESPGRSLELSIGECVFTHYNTVIRIFDAPNEDYDHIEYEHSDGKCYGLRFPQEILDEMFELNYPMLSMPFVDEATAQWFDGMNQEKLNEAIAEILGE